MLQVQEQVSTGARAGVTDLNKQLIFELLDAPACENSACSAGRTTDLSPEWNKRLIQANDYIASCFYSRTLPLGNAL
jgi:hypothetical protein